MGAPVGDIHVCAHVPWLLACKHPLRLTHGACCNPPPVYFHVVAQELSPVAAVIEPLLS